jgi:hypothetical protein
MARLAALVAGRIAVPLDVATRRDLKRKSSQLILRERCEKPHYKLRLLLRNLL